MTKFDSEERFIEKDKIDEASVAEMAKLNKKEKEKEKKSKNKKILIWVTIIIIVAFGIGIGILTLFSGNDANTNNTNTITDNINSIAENDNDNTNIPAINISVNEEITLTGRVFIKAYGSPSESYGILSTEGNEVGFGTYDSMREEFRPYVNENVTVKFSSICKSTLESCCNSVFFYCGTVSEWEPVEETN